MLFQRANGWCELAIAINIISFPSYRLNQVSSGWSPPITVVTDDGL